MKRRVVITGLGTVNPLANDTLTTWERARAGHNGIAHITRFDTSAVDVTIAGEIKGLDTEAYFGKKQLKRMDRFVQLGVIATDEAIKDAAFDMEALNKQRVGVFYGSGIGGIETIANQTETGLNKGFNRISPFFIPMAIINIVAGNIAIKYGFKGPATASVTACASAANSIGDGFRNIRDGYLDVCVTGGSEASITPLGIGGFRVMHALNTSNDPDTASKPFDKNRSGFVMGEGAGTLILESYEHAKQRGAKIYGEIIGYGATCDANHITSPDPEGEGALNCMRMALEDGNIPLDMVDHINAHGTSTPLNDKVETLAIRKLFGTYADNISISATKSMSGHLLGASGALEAIFSVLAVRDDYAPPTINYKDFDPECNLDYTVNEGKKKTLRVALSNSLGFGGHNATLAFKKWEG